MGRLSGIDPPPLFLGTGKKSRSKTPLFQYASEKYRSKTPPPFFLGFLGKKSIVDPFFRPDIDFRSPFFGTIDFRVSGPQGAYLSSSVKECPPPPPPPPPYSFIHSFILGSGLSYTLPCLRPGPINQSSNPDAYIAGTMEPYNYGHP